MENSNNLGKMVGALLIGAAIGGVLGVLFAPKKGSETRKNISQKGEDFTEAIKEKFNEFLESISEKYDKVKEDIVEYKENKKA